MRVVAVLLIASVLAPVGVAHASRKKPSGQTRVENRARHQREVRERLPRKTARLVSAHPEAHELAVDFLVRQPRQEKKLNRRALGRLRQQLRLAEIPAPLRREARALFAEADRLGLSLSSSETASHGGGRGYVSVSYWGTDRKNPDLHYMYRVSLHRGDAPALFVERDAYDSSKQPASSGIQRNLQNRVTLRVDGDAVSRHVSRGTRPTAYSKLSLVERKGRVSLTGAVIEPDNVTRIHESD